jgi:hypothetical protein
LSCQENLLGVFINEWLLFLFLPLLKVIVQIVLVSKLNWK